MPLYVLKGNFLWLLVYNFQTENVFFFKYNEAAVHNPYRLLCWVSVIVGSQRCSTTVNKTVTFFFFVWDFCHALFCSYQCACFTFLYYFKSFVLILYIPYISFVYCLCLFTQTRLPHSETVFCTNMAIHNKLLCQTKSLH